MAKNICGLIILAALVLAACGPQAEPPGIGSTLAREQDGMVMVYVPAGEFIMGSVTGFDDEKPARTITLDAFWIDQTEVTNAMYAQCVAAGACSLPARTSFDLVGIFQKLEYYGDPQNADHPVIWIDWEQASAYCGWAGSRLPSEAEWEKAARGPDGRVFPWGDVFARRGLLLNFCDKNCDVSSADRAFDDGYALPAPVGSYPDGASFYGALDMAGNVSEWVADWYSETYYQDGPDHNPPGPASGESRVYRGGSYRDWEKILRSSNRNRSPSKPYDFLGFRCARPAP
jgi:eukaryotic-like serine/threonine-protein kinase